MICISQGIFKVPDLKYRSKGRFAGKVLAALAAITLLFPSSATVLCISPDHVALEDLNELCCESSGLSSPAGLQTDDSFRSEGQCGRCRDFFMTPYGRAGLSESYANVSPHPQAGEFFEDHLSLEPCLFPDRTGTDHHDALSPGSPFTPLRR